MAGGTIWASLTAYGRAGEDAQRIGYGDDAAAALLSPRGQLLDISMYDVAVAAANPPPSAAAIDPAARAVPADPAEVIATGAETWAVRTASGLVPVSPPRARPTRPAAAFLGRDTREVLAGL